VDDIIKDQILAVRDTGLTNMFDINSVLEIAYGKGFDEAVEWIRENKAAYCKFILNGDEK